jgi:hypothetical protein
VKKVIKIILSIPIVIICCVVVFFIISFISLFFAPAEELYHSVVTEIHKGCYIEDVDCKAESIYYYPDGDESKEKVYIVDEWEEVIKYTSNGKNIVAFHCIYNYWEDSKKDLFVVFNTDTEEKLEFKTQELFLEYCNNEKIKLSDWVPCNGYGYEIIDLGNDWCVYDFDYPETDKILNGYGIEYEGFVTDIKKKGNNEVEFIFAVPEWAEKEIPESNKNLDISETVIGEYKFALFGKDEVTYYERLSLDTKTGEITVVTE